MVVACDRVRDLAPGFVLGALEEAEMASVREHLSTCARPHPELREIGGVLPYLGGSLDPVEPPRHLRAAVMSAALEDLRARSAENAAPEAAPVVTVLEPVSSAGVVSLPRVRTVRTRRVAAWLTRVAAAVAVVSLVGYAVAVQGDLNHAHQAQATANSFYSQYNVQGVLHFVLTPEAGRQGAGDALLLPSGHVQVLLHGLAPTTGDEVYMVWSSVDGAAITRAGWFTVDDQGQGFLEIGNESPSSWLWLMVCLEPNSSAQKPTGPVIVTGALWLYSFPSATTPV
jgi:hypothetical protein